LFPIDPSGDDCHLRCLCYLPMCIFLGEHDGKLTQLGSRLELPTFLGHAMVLL
jgi:hypothetical protein